MGVVWAAINENTEREVAIKLILGSPKNQGLRERLLREARASGRIAHRNVVEIYDVGETEQGQPFLVMQMLRGETLASWLERAGPLPVATITAIAVDILRALIAAHAAGVVHRDLKPENVFLHQESDGFTVLKVVDFGVSKLLDSDDPTTSITGVPIGSPAYMSPEQARGDRDVGPPSDVWAVGVILFEMLAARRPFVGATSYEVVRLVQQGNAPRLSSLVPEVDPGIDDLVARCLDRTATARPSASQALEALAPFVPPGEISSRRSFQPSPSSPGLASSDAVPGASLADLAAGRATLTDSASMPAAPTASKTRPSPATPRRPEWAAPDPPRSRSLQRRTPPTGRRAPGPRPTRADRLACSWGSGCSSRCSLCYACKRSLPARARSPWPPTALLPRLPPAQAPWLPPRLLRRACWPLPRPRRRRAPWPPPRPRRARPHWTPEITTAWQERPARTKAAQRAMRRPNRPVAPPGAGRSEGHASMASNFPASVDVCWSKHPAQ
jgi:serine/threonine-protein kinase